METNNKLDSFITELQSKRELHSCTISLKNNTVNFINSQISLLFPHFAEKIDNKSIPQEIDSIKNQLIKLINSLNGLTKIDAESVTQNYIEKLPDIHNKLWMDANAIYDGDPAAESIDEVILAYPGFMAILIYRFAHELYKLRVPIIPRIMSEHAHQITGVDIHPGAVIGSPFFIDHGTGIVIGETTVIGNNVKIYQGVTLGALSVKKELSNVKRHPTIEDDVIIYAQSVILGGNTVIGKNSVIGGNSWIVQSISPNSVVNNKNEVRIKSNKDFEEPINFII
ncbi:MAG: serine acetyltransferase [Melioribacter sp.]|nr:serine acetyltransferase [Melioribacter sp.]